MKIQYENRVMSSLLLYIDHFVCEKGEAFTNSNSYFYETNQTYSNLFNYSSPYKQLVSDDSVSNANVMKTVYIDSGGSFKEFQGGASGVSAIDHTDALVQTTNQITGVNRISGNFSVKEFNTYLTNKAEEKILFETKYQLKPKTPQTLTGLPPDTETYPAIFLKNMSAQNTPGAYGGLDLTNVTARAIILADSAYNLDAVCSILADRNKTVVTFIEQSLPFNAVGAYTGQAYNYTGLVDSATGAAKTGIFIDNVSVSKNVAGDYSSLNPNVYTAFIDFELNQFRFPRK